MPPPRATRLSPLSVPSVTVSSPSRFALQLPIRYRLTQLALLALLEPLDFRPIGVSPFYTLLMSTFLLLIACGLLSSIFRLGSTKHSTTCHFCGTDASVTILASSIYDAIRLLEYAATRLLSDWLLPCLLPLYH